MSIPKEKPRLLKPGRQAYMHGLIASFSLFTVGLVTHTHFEPEAAIAPLVGMVITHWRYKKINHD